MNYSLESPASDASISTKVTHALKRPWLSWIEGDGSLVIRASDEPCLFLRVMPWHMRLQLGLRHEWVDYGKARDIGWEWLRDDINLVLLDNEWFASRNLPIRKYAQNIPAQIRETAVPYKQNQLRLLQSLSAYPEARDLATHNPNLLWILACSSNRRASNSLHIRGLLNKKQDSLLSLLIGRPVTNSAVKFLQKVCIINGNKSFKELLLEVLSDKRKIGLFSHHWHRIPQSAVSLIASRNSDVLSKCLAMELATTNPSDWDYKITVTDRLWSDLEKLANTLGNNRAVRDAISRLRNVSQMQRLHDRWTYKIYNQEITNFIQSKQANIPFPESPIPENNNIVQIRNYKELFNEGKVMRHCIFSRYESVFTGDTFYYRLYWPERCTLEIMREYDEWKITEFKLEDNKEPSPKSWKCVRNWLLGSETVS